MIEPLFGSAPPPWTAMESPPSLWAAMAQSGRIPAGGTPIPSPSQIRMSAEALGYGAAPSLPFNGAFGIPGTITSFGATELIAPTAALVAVVATRRGQPAGPGTDAEIEDFLNDALDLIPGTSDVEVRCEGGRAILTGSVPHKRHKRDVGEIAWAIPSINDVQNNVAIVARRRARASVTGREAETHTGPVRKHA